MRIAFITSEFVTDYKDGGGLGNYLNRMGKLLVERGHQVEVFLPSNLEPRVLMHEGIRVERIPLLPKKLLINVFRRIHALMTIGHPTLTFSQAHKLAAAMERRHQVAHFDIVQSADFRAVGLAVRRVPNRVHLVRCSSAADLYNCFDGHVSRADKRREELERRAIRNADRAYAPSRFVAEHYQREHGIHLEVVRPPFGAEVTPAAEPPCALPNRFFLHFGQLIRRKGTHWLCEALKRVFDVEPSFRMVWAGPGDIGEIDALLAGLGRHRAKVQVLGPLPKPQIYAVLQNSEAAVLPSLVDNLPNTVIESLMLGIPVIGTRGASIDELVQDGVTGELVLPGDVDGLASIILKVWRGQSAVQKGFVWCGGGADEMQPERAIHNFLKLAGQKGNPCDS
jgi:glycosyltransferase involved in cell wall biosynthesis